MSTDFSTVTDGDYLPPSLPQPVEEKNFYQHRVFINHVDSFHAKYIASYLTDQIYGASRARGGMGEGEEEPFGEEEEAKTKTILPPIFGEKYEIVGTLQEKFHQPTEDILYTIDEGDDALLTAEILKCGFVIYDISQDESEISKANHALEIIEKELERINAIGPKTFYNFPDVRVFILISTVMTWGLTKPLDPDEPDIPFNEGDYRKRKPHPNYKNYLACEREVILKGKKWKDKLKVYVICSGITYGMEEEQLAFYFKLAWNNEKYLPVFKKGTNFIPLIHIKDLAKVIHGVCETTPRKPNYILAVEQTPCTLKQIVKALSKAMGRGRIKEISEAEAFLYNNFSQKAFDICTVNLNMEPGFIAEDLEIEWQNELNLAENMSQIVSEFRISRKLRPLRVLLHGPPAGGKTVLAQRICDYYGTKYISVKTCIEEKIKDLKEAIELKKEQLKQKEEKEKAKEEAAQYDEDEEPGEEEEEEDELGDIEELEEQLRDIENTLSYSDTGKLPDDYVIRLMKELLMSNQCQNQGYVLDGFPKTMQQTKELFGQASEAGGEEEGGEEEGGEGGGAPKILPDFIFSLEATDEFLCNRIMEKPESEIQGTHYEEEHMLRRLAEYRANNTEDNTLLNFFDEIEIHPKVLDIMKYKENDIEPLFNFAMETLGEPIGFQPTLEEEREAAALEEEMRKLKEEEARLAKEIKEKTDAEEYYRKMEEWTTLLEEYQMEEEKLLVVQSEPLRNYLMKFVFPTLTRGLIETARMKPEDPIDFLAEFLFRENPEGRMFDPAYTREGVLIEEEEECEEGSRVVLAPQIITSTKDLASQLDQMRRSALLLLQMQDAPPEQEGE